MERDGRGEDTILIVNADHGARYGGALRSADLRPAYNTNPMLRVFIPKSLASKVGTVMQSNQNILTHALDLTPLSDMQSRRSIRRMQRFGVRCRASASSESYPLGAVVPIVVSRIAVHLQHRPKEAHIFSCPHGSGRACDIRAVLAGARRS